MPFDETYKESVRQLRREGRLSDYAAGELKVKYTIRRRLFALCALIVVAAWLLTIQANSSWIAIAIATVLFATPFLYCMGQTISLEHKISRVSERSSDAMEGCLEELLAPFPDLHNLFHQWLAQGPLWRHDEVRLMEAARRAKAAV